MPAGVALGHLAIELGWVSAPEGAGQWGLASVGLGFSFLLASLAISYRLRSLESAVSTTAERELWRERHTEP